MEKKKKKEREDENMKKRKRIKRKKNVKEIASSAHFRTEKLISWNYAN